MNRLFKAGLLFATAILLAGCSNSSSDPTMPPNKVQDYLKELYRNRNDSQKAAKYSYTGSLGTSVIKISDFDYEHFSHVKLSIATELKENYYEGNLWLMWKDRDTPYVTNNITYVEPKTIYGYVLGLRSNGENLVLRSDSTTFVLYKSEVNEEKHTLGNNITPIDSLTIYSFYEEYASAAINWFVDLVYTNTGEYYI